MTAITLTLDAVILAVTGERLQILVVSTDDDRYRLPFGPLDLEGDATLERGIRRCIKDQTGLEVGYVEQLYTFGDRHRRQRQTDPRLLSIAYLALVREEQPLSGAAWLDYYALFPWEDHRRERPGALEKLVLPCLERWARGSETRQARFQVSFGAGPAPWDPIRVLERYELLYEVGLVHEAFIDRGDDPPADRCAGLALAVDHRRIAASALGRLRGKLTYRPVVFELLPEQFTLTQLQLTVEVLSGTPIHKQNFRRLIESSRLVEGTGELSVTTGGRPAKLFRFRREVLGERPRPGVFRSRL